jgi:hypothetical protein
MAQTLVSPLSILAGLNMQQNPSKYWVFIARRRVASRKYSMVQQ